MATTAGVSGILASGTKDRWDKEECFMKESIENKIIEEVDTLKTAVEMFDFNCLEAQLTNGDIAALLDKEIAGIELKAIKDEDDDEISVEVLIKTDDGEYGNVTYTFIEAVKAFQENYKCSK